MGKKKKAPFKIITDAPKFRDRLGELTGNELKVWMYFWLRTNGELTAFPGNKTIASELKISVDTVKDAKRGLRAKGWTSRESQRRRDDGKLSTVVEKTHLPWGGNPSTDTVVEKTDGGKTHQQKEYSVDLEVPPSPSAMEDSVKPLNFEGGNNNNRVVVVPQTPEVKAETLGLVSGYTQEQIAAQAEACRLNPWVHANDSPSARKREGFVQHLMTIDPPRTKKALPPGLPAYRYESGRRNIFGEMCNKCGFGGANTNIGKDGFCDECRKKLGATA
jgi:hypothetical protein